MMATEELVLEKLRVLPPAKQQSVLDFVEFLLFQDSYSLAAILADIRARNRQTDPAELDSLVEEARTNFYHSRQVVQNGS